MPCRWHGTTKETRQQRQKEGIALAKADGRNKGRTADSAKHQQIIAFRIAGKSIADTAKLVGCRVAQVKKVWAESPEGKAAALARQNSKA